jgi:hypothetical protein
MHRRDYIVRRGVGAINPDAADLDCGDGLHPSNLGYCKMGDAIDVMPFD